MIFNQPPFSTLISSLPVVLHAVRVSRDFWEPWFAGAGLRAELDAIFENAQEVCISRERIFKHYADARLQCLEVLLWGYPTGMRGNHHQAFLGNLDEISRCASIDAAWPDYFDRLNAMHGLGMSTITKLAYFFRKEFDGYTALILDQRILKVLSRGFWPELEELKHMKQSNACRNYLLYLKRLDSVSRWSRDASVDQLEFFLFLLGDAFGMTGSPERPVGFLHLGP
jgi:hypothetical protein